MNSLQIYGRLGQKPELRNTASGLDVTAFRLAYRRTKDQSDWFTVIAFGQLAKRICANASKGARINVSGRLQSRQYEKDGQKREAVEIIADSVDFLDPPPMVEISEEKGELPF